MLSVRKDRDDVGTAFMLSVRCIRGNFYEDNYCVFE